MSYVINIFNVLTLSDNTMMRRNKLKSEYLMVKSKVPNC